MPMGRAIILEYPPLNQLLDTINPERPRCRPPLPGGAINRAPTTNGVNRGCPCCPPPLPGGAINRAPTTNAINRGCPRCPLPNTRVALGARRRQLHHKI